jgi:hypothetical protein
MSKVAVKPARCFGSLEKAESNFLDRFDFGSIQLPYGSCDVLDWSLIVDVMVRRDNFKEKLQTIFEQS